MTKIYKLKILVVFMVSVFIGLVVFKLTDNKVPYVQKIVTNQNRILDTTPKPTLPPIDENSSLEGELEKLTPQDYSEDFKKLKGEVKDY